jgi:hypothetical protein
MGAAEASGGLYSSVRDLARYVAFQLAAYPPRSAPDDGPVRRATLREAHTVGIADGGWLRAAIAPRPGEPVVEYAARSWGLGWGAVTTCDFDDLVGKGGSIDSYRADITLLTARGVGIVVLSNFGNADPIAFANRALRELARSGALARRAPRLPAAFQPAMTAFLAVYNRWSEPAYRSMLDPDRGPAPGEPDELADYQRLHGACASFTVIDVTSPREARFALRCERGSFEIALALSSTSGRITGFTGTSRGVAAPAEIRAAADAISALTARWSADAYDRLPGGSRPDRDTAKTMFEGLRAAHGACRVAELVHEGVSWTAELACDRGGGLLLDLGAWTAREPRRSGAFELRDPATWFRARPGCPLR